MLAFDEALARLLASAPRVGAERVSIDEADRRVLAEPIVAPYALPSFDHSSMDGYALASAEVIGPGPFDMEVIGESAAGGETPVLHPGSACRIFTGAPLPAGADTVLMQEDVEARELAGARRIGFSKRPEPGAWIRRKGDDLEAGALALAPGAVLGPGTIALAASLDRASLLVARKPVVTVLGSGDELRAPGQPGGAGTIVESNGTFVALAARRCGALARLGPYVRDEPDVARAAIEGSLVGADLVITIGGVSVGARDVIRPALEAAGVTIDFYKVAMKPGKPLTVGRRGATTVLGLPGNPASASLTFLLFGAPLLRAMQGHPHPTPQRSKMIVRTGRIDRSAGRMEFMRATIEDSGGGRAARVLSNQASGAVTSFARAEALVVVPADRIRIEDGDELEVIRIADVFGE